MKYPPRAKRHSLAAHGGPFSVASAGRGVLDFSSNVLPGGPPPAVASAIRSALTEAESYPDPESKKMKKCLASYMGVGVRAVAVGNGATELIYRFCTLALPERTSVCVQSPAFAEYESASLLAGHRVKKFPSASLTGDLEKFARAIPRGGCAFVCNPNNPTGGLLEKNDILYLADAAGSKSAVLFVDESFIELVPGKSRSVARIAYKRNDLFVLRSMTKSFSIPGIRVGYCAAGAETADLLNRTCQPWNVSTPAQRAACAAVASHGGHLNRARRMVAKESAFLQKGIAGMDGYECVGKPSANFMMVRTPSDSVLLQKRLLGRRILVRECASFGPEWKSHIRIAVRTRPENMRLLEALKCA